jgi:hypothetical protein
MERALQRPEQIAFANHGRVALGRFQDPGLPCFSQGEYNIAAQGGPRRSQARSARTGPFAAWRYIRGSARGGGVVDCELRHTPWKNIELD